MKGRIGLSAGCLVALCFFAALSAGCGGLGAEETETLEVLRDGQVILYIVDSFDKGYYDTEELEKMVREEADAYNGKKRMGADRPVTVEEVTRVGREKEKVCVVYRFRDGEAYAGFQGETLYYETLEQAVASKHVFSGAVLFDESGTVTLDEKTRSKLKGKHVIVTDAKTRIVLPGKALYVSEGVKLLEDGSADTSASEDTAVILLKK